MTARWRGWLLAGIQVTLVASLALKYAVDRRTMPHVWVRSAPYDPDLPIRGRYVRLRIETAVDPALLPRTEDGAVQNRFGFAASPARFVVDNDRLLVRGEKDGETIWITQWELTPTAEGEVGHSFLQEPVAYFIPEHVEDPSRQPAGSELWVEVTVPRRGPPRPIRLGVKSGGVLTPLDLD